MMKERLLKSPQILIKSQTNLVTMIFVHSWAKRTRIFMMLLKWQMHYSPRYTKKNPIYSSLIHFNLILSDLIYRETLWTLQLSKLQFLFCSNILYVNTNISVRIITFIDIEILLLKYF